MMILFLILLKYQKKWEEFVDQSRIQRHSKDIFGLSNNQLELVRHCRSSTILSHKYKIFLLSTYVENISTKVLGQISGAVSSVCTSTFQNPVGFPCTAVIPV